MEMNLEKTKVRERKKPGKNRGKGQNLHTANSSRKLAQGNGLKGICEFLFAVFLLRLSPLLKRVFPSVGPLICWSVMAL